MAIYIVFLRSPFLGRAAFLGRATNANELRRSQNDQFWSISNGLSQSYSHFSRGQEMLTLGTRLRSPCHTSRNLREHDLRWKTVCYSSFIANSEKCFWAPDRNRTRNLLSIPAWGSETFFWVSNCAWVANSFPLIYQAANHPSYIYMIWDVLKNQLKRESLRNWVWIVRLHAIYRAYLWIRSMVPWIIKMICIITYHYYPWWDEMGNQRRELSPQITPLTVPWS